MGSDVRKGEILVQKGTEMGPAEIGLVASVGSGSVMVHRAPVVGVMSTGDELVDAGGSGDCSECMFWLVKYERGVALLVLLLIIHHFPLPSNTPIQTHLYSYVSMPIQSRVHLRQQPPHAHCFLRAAAGGQGPSGGFRHCAGCGREGGAGSGDWEGFTAVGRVALGWLLGM